MKKYCFYALSLFAAAVLSVGMTSCGDDDDEKGGSGGGAVAASDTPSPVITDIYGVKHQVASFLYKYSSNDYDGYTYKYDTNGKLTGIYEDNEKSVLTGPGLTFVDAGKDSNDEWNETSAFALNSSGYVSGASYSYSEKEDDGEWEQGTGSASFSYDGAGQLTDVVYSFKGSYFDDGATYAFSYNGKYSLTWENSKLMSIKEDWSETDTGDDDGTETGTTLISFEYGSQANPARQWLWTMSGIMDAIEDFYGESLAPLGLFGRGPAYLPTQYARSSSSSSGNSYNYPLSYTTNDNGLINSDNGYTYTYDTVNTTKVVVSPSQQGGRNKIRSIRQRFQNKKAAFAN